MNNLTPIDSRHTVYLILFLHGIGALIAWNMFINAESYFVEYKLNVGNNSTSETLKDYRKNFLSYLGIASKAPNILFQFINLFFSSHYLSLSKRIWSSLLIQSIIFILTVVLATVDSSEWPEVFFWLTMGSAFIINMANGIFQACIYGIAAKLPIKYTNAVTIGFNLSGVVAAIFMIISIAIAPTHKVVAIYFFSFAVIYLLFCFCNEFIVRKNNYYLHYMNIESKTKTSDEITAIDLKSYKSNGSEQTVDECNNTECCPINAVENNGPDLTGIKVYLYVFKRIWLLLLNIIVIYFITFSLFPSLQANIKPIDHIIDDKYFVPVFCFLTFPLFKTIGNYLAELLPRPSVKSLIIYSLIRIIFIPVFLFCNFNPTDRTVPVLIKNDFLYIIGSTLMPLTSGYLSSICLMYCPISVEPKYASIAGMMASFTILFGILLGLNFSLIYPIIVNV